MKMSHGELLYRLSILILRAVKDKTPVELIGYFKEFKGKDSDTLIRLLEVNNQIWQLESDIRKGKEGQLSIEEVGRRALMIRDLNKVRVQLKGETKVDHASK